MSRVETKQEPRLTFSHQHVEFVFEGRALPPPDPGTYDAAAWTPPTHEIFRVRMYREGWTLILGAGEPGMKIESGGYGVEFTKSRGSAKRIIERFLDRVEKSVSGRDSG